MFSFIASLVPHLTCFNVPPLKVAVPEEANGPFCAPAEASEQHINHCSGRPVAVLEAWQVVSFPSHLPFVPGHPMGSPSQGQPPAGGPFPPLQSGTRAITASLRGGTPATRRACPH